MLRRTAAQARLAVGLMSGTSMDGIDAALVRISGAADQPRVQLLAFVTLPYPSAVRERLLCVAGGAPTTTGEISELNFLLGELFAAAALEVCRHGGISPERLSVIGSHGQTIYHHGQKARSARMRDRGLSRSDRAARPSTLQIASPAVIAEKTGAPVVADFRTADVAAGGQGAPLVPLVDYLLLRDARLGGVALNIGGIANVTVMPAGARPDDVIGFDTGPGNMVIDALARQFTRGRQSFDSGGRLAERGAVIEPVLKEALHLPFFRRRPPKSAGREQFGNEFVRRYFLSRHTVSPYDLIRTATELTARSIADALRRFVFPEAKIQRLIVSGGGAHNRLLVRRLQELLPQVSVLLSDEFGLPVDAKEAIAFALLADRTVHVLPGNLPSVTGARRAVILGTLTWP